jgi:hypothetical protein
MGLLDDAIREHLELKRRSGADPTAVEREELEALAPVFDDAEPALRDGYAGLAQVPAAAPGYGDAAPMESHQSGDVRLAHFDGAGQDTAELDMQAVLEEDVVDAVAPVGLAGGAMRTTRAEETLAGEPLEREQTDALDRESAPADIPGQERLSFE